MFALRGQGPIMKFTLEGLKMPGSNPNKIQSETIKLGEQLNKFYGSIGITAIAAALEAIKMGSKKVNTPPKYNKHTD